MSDRRRLNGTGIFVALASFFLAATLESAPPEVDRYEGLLTASVVGEATFETPNLLALEQELSKSHPSPRAVIIDAFPYHFARNLLYGTPTTDMSYDMWASQYKYGMSHLKDVKAKRIIRMGDDAVLQSYDAGHFSEDVTSGTNPTLMRIAGVNFRMLEVRITPAVRLPNSRAIRPTMIAVYLQGTPLPPVSVARSLSQDIARRISVSSLFVDIRSDTWFIDDPDFPIWCPFAPPSRPPDTAHYLYGAQVFCKVAQGRVSCR
jgi:hypothetical protein